MSAMTWHWTKMNPQLSPQSLSYKAATNFQQLHQKCRPINIPHLHSPEQQERNRKEPPHIASAIVMQVAKLNKSKCNTFCKLARARAMKFAYSQKQARQIAGSQMRPQRSPQSARAIASQKRLRVTRATAMMSSQ